MRRTVATVGSVAIAGAVSVGLAGSQAGPAAFPVSAIGQDAVQVTGGFWQAKLETNRRVSIPHIFDQNEKTGRVDNFRKGAGQMPGEYLGRRFNDTDIYKAIEAASYSLIDHPDPVLSAKIDALVELIGKSQEADGYLFPARTIDPAKPAPGVGTERWIHENTGSHELYNAGHLYEAAVAHHRATGKRTLLDIAVRNADLVRRTFGPAARVDTSGHEEVELALVKLFDATRDQRYLDLARFFLDVRGTDHRASQDYTERSWLLYNDRAYRQDDKPVTEQTQGQGHAVRATYLYAAMADIAGRQRDAAYDRAVTRIWDDVYSKRSYITGGLGTVPGTEAFGGDYVLPSATAYTETCASVGGILWGHRMFLKSGEARYLDVLEQTLYNGLLSGVSVAGDTFFYQNPLEAGPRSRNNARSAYFDVACCPANLARLVAQLPALVYAQRDRDVFVNLFVDSTASLTVGGQAVTLAQKTEYPWQGAVGVTVGVTSPTEFALRIRRPGWLGPGPYPSDLYRFTKSVAEAPSVTVNGQPVSPRVDGGWLVVSRRWADGDQVALTLPMPVRRVAPHPEIKDAIGKLALQRGPIVYALEGADHGGVVLDVVVPAEAAFTPAFRADLLGGVTTLTATVPGAGGSAPRALTAVPYFAWANRGRGEMVLWMPSR